MLYFHDPVSYVILNWSKLKRNFEQINPPMLLFFSLLKFTKNWSRNQPRSAILCYRDNSFQSQYSVIFDNQFKLKRLPHLLRLWQFVAMSVATATSSETWFHTMRKVKAYVRSLIPRKLLIPTSVALEHTTWKTHARRCSVVSTSDLERYTWVLIEFFL